MENFKKDTIISGGTKDHPYHKEIGEYKCILCKIDVETISTESRFRQRETMRGTLNMNWDEVTVKCPKCEKQETYDDLYQESDGNYYSNEERRVYNIR